MPIPVRFLLGSPGRLIAAIVLFVLLDLAVLLINLWIAAHVARDAVAINLAGRQRMLSQQVTKSLLLAHHAPDAAKRDAACMELTKAFDLFERTLHAFDKGGETLGGDGKPVTLAAIRPAEPGRSSVDDALVLMVPITEHLEELRTYGRLSDEARSWAVDYMTRNNRKILALMNQLTTALEQSSVERISRLRIIQTAAFTLALVNFLVIVLGLVRQYRHVEEAGQRWRVMAEHDPLTGLYNRSAFREGLTSAIDQADREGKSMSVLLLDLDGFKPINDRFGHAAGDHLLGEVAYRLQRAARESDIVARLGGDEFALLCPHLHNHDHIQLFCERVIDSIDGIVNPAGESPAVRASIGVAVYPTHGSNVDELLGTADRAMYKSKSGGGGNWSMAEPYRPAGWPSLG